MPKISKHRNTGKTYGTPRRPFEKERLDQELKLCGEYGLRCKREIWRVQLMLARVRKAARKLLTLDEKDPRRMFEGDALLRRMVRYGVLGEEEKKLDYVLQLTTSKLLERRLQTQVFKTQLAKSVHQARVFIKQGHIRVGKQIVNAPSFLLRTESEGHVDFSARSSIAGARLGRVKRKKAKSAGAAADDE